MQSYKQLTIQERHMIAALLSIGEKPAEIAARLGRSRSTIREEIKRGTENGAYDAEAAHRLARARKANNAKRLDESVWENVLPLLHEKWSPEQIAGSGACGVSHMSIYRWIARDKRAGGRVYRLLRHGRPYRQRHTRETRGRIPNRRDIADRPPVVEKRQRVGDWELDLVIGGNHRGAIISVNERRTGLSVQRWIPSKHADAVADGVIVMLYPLRQFVLTITSDNGAEFAGHERIAQMLGCDFYFARPHAPWQRGSNENTNGLIRQYFRKGESMERVEGWRVHDMTKQLNKRPRKRLNYKTPLREFADLTGMDYIAVAESIRIQ